MKFYVTFKDKDTHKINNKNIDSDIVVVLNSENYDQARKQCFSLFNDDFSYLHTSEEWKEHYITYYPKGYVEINAKKPNVKFTVCNPIKKIPQIIVANYKTQYDLTMSFVRIQEFYEGPKHKNKFFTLEEYMDYWAENFGHGVFDYTSKWGGFNFSGKVLQKFIKIYWRNMRAKESLLIDKITDLVLQTPETNKTLKNTYIIGMCKNNPKKIYKSLNKNFKLTEDNETICHEIAHALYCLNTKYKNNINKMLANPELKDDIERASQTLKEMGYGKNVIKDEIQAYWSTTPRAIPTLKLKENFYSHFKSYF